MIQVQNEDVIFEAGYMAGASGRTDMSESDKKMNASDAYQEFLKKREQHLSPDRDPKTPNIISIERLDKVFQITETTRTVETWFIDAENKDEAEQRRSHEDLEPDTVMKYASDFSGILPEDGIVEVSRAIAVKQIEDYQAMVRASV
jgi:hypothetical protein